MDDKEGAAAVDSNKAERPDFRGLYEKLLSDETLPAVESILRDWCRDHGAAAREFFGRLSMSSDLVVPAMPIEDLWGLYAFSRVNETLLLGFQPLRAHQHPWAPDVTRDQWRVFIEAMGLRVMPAERFTPFLHEIVSVDQAPDDEAGIAVVHELWPAAMHGNLLISRAGVAVSGGRNHVRKEIAEASTLYWAHRRRNRTVSDLSDGWGSNSQWRTSFRRDYRVGKTCLFNVDGRADPTDDPNEDRDGLTPSERIELTVHRCFITTNKPHHDLWPYDDRRELYI